MHDIHRVLHFMMYLPSYLFVRCANKFLYSIYFVGNTNCKQQSKCKKKLLESYTKKRMRKNVENCCVCVCMGVGRVYTSYSREFVTLYTFYFALVYPYLTFICWFQQLACAAFTFIHIFICFGAPLPLHTVAALYSSYCLEFDICTWWQQHYGWIQKQ